MSDRYQLAYDGVAGKRWVVIDTLDLTCGTTPTIICYAESGETAETIRRALVDASPDLDNPVGDWLFKSKDDPRLVPGKVMDWGC